MEKRNNFAVLIDADNVSPERFERIFGELSLWGNATYRRIYGNWADYNRSALKEKLVEYALTPVQQFNYIKGKNATDIALVIDAMDILYTGTVDGFCIVTNDSDFTRLALRLRESGMIVIGMGDDVAASSFRTACNDFVVLRESRRIAEEITEQKRIRLTARRSAVRSGSEIRTYAGKAAAARYDEPRSVDNAAANDADADNTAAAAESLDLPPEEPVQAPEPRKVLSDRDLRNSIKDFLFGCTEDDGWYSASTLVNRLKEKYPDLDIKDYADLPLFAGKRKIWTTYFLSLGFCENMQKGPSNYLLRLKADERRKLAEERKAAGIAAEKAPEKAPEKAAAETPAADKVPASTAAEKSAAAEKNTAADKPAASGRRRGHRGGAAHRSAAAKAEASAKAEAGAEAAVPAKTEAAPEPKPEAKPEVKAEAKPEAKTEVKAEVKAAAKTGTSRGRKRTSAKPAESAPVNAEKASGEAPEKAAEQAAKNAADKPAQKRVGRPPKKQTEKQAEKPAEKAAEPKPETAADKPAEKKTSRRGRPRKNASEKASAD